MPRQMRIWLRSWRIWMRIIELDGNGMGVGGDDEFVRSSNGIYWFMIQRKRRLQTITTSLPTLDPTFAIKPNNNGNEFFHSTSKTSPLSSASLNLLDTISSTETVAPTTISSSLSSSESSTASAAVVPPLLVPEVEEAAASPIVPSNTITSCFVHRQDLTTCKIELP